MKIGIITFHRAYNCGAALQACALSAYLSQNGHKAYFPNSNTVGVEKAHFSYIKLTLHPLAEAIKSLLWYFGREILSLGSEDVKRFRYRRFMSKHILAISDKTFHNRNTAKCLIFGSDQIWNEKLTKQDSALFLGESIKNIPKIAYAASMGDPPPSDTFWNRIKKAAKDFDAVSVREQPVGNVLQDKIGSEATTVLDPTLLMGKSFYLKLANPKRLHARKFIFVYLVPPSPETLSLAKKIAAKKKLDVVCVDACQKGLWRCDPCTDLMCSPDRFLSYVRDCEFVITNSFHGTAFSIAFNKHFAVTSPEGNGIPSRRISTLLLQLNLTDRVVNSSADDFSKIDEKITSDIPESARETLKRLSLTSGKWLLDALNRAGNVS